jgi:hypothetical protein
MSYAGPGMLAEGGYLPRKWFVVDASDVRQMIQNLKNA